MIKQVNQEAHTLDSELGVSEAPAAGVCVAVNCSLIPVVVSVSH